MLPTFCCISRLLRASKSWHDWQGELQNAQGGHRLGWGVPAVATACAGVCRLGKGTCKEAELHLFKATSSWPSLAFVFFISVILVPPLTTFYGRIEEFSVSGSAIFLFQCIDPNTNIWRQLFGSQVQQKHPKSRGSRAPGSHGHTPEAVLEHTRGWQG